MTAIIALLIVLIMVQQFFWMIHCQKLTDKVMSRNYNEYMQAQNLSPPKPAFDPEPEEEQDLGALSGIG